MLTETRVGSLSEAVTGYRFGHVAVSVSVSNTVALTRALYLQKWHD